MPHDASKIKMGSTLSSDRTVDNRKGEIAAGLAVRLKTDGGLSVASADGNLLGISLGKDLSGAKHTAVCRRGLDVPILLTAAFEPAIGAQVNISNTTGKAGAAGAGFTAVNAIYTSTKKTAILEDGTESADGAAYIDMQGGL